MCANLVAAGHTVTAGDAGSKVAILAGQGACGAWRELEEVAELLGAGVAKPLPGKDVLSDELPT